MSTHVTIAYSEDDTADIADKINEQLGNRIGNGLVAQEVVTVALCPGYHTTAIVVYRCIPEDHLHPAVRGNMEVEA